MSVVAILVALAALVLPKQENKERLDQLTAR